MTAVTKLLIQINYTVRTVTGENGLPRDDIINVGYTLASKHFFCRCANFSAGGQNFSVFVQKPLFCRAASLFYKPSILLSLTNNISSDENKKMINAVSRHVRGIRVWRVLQGGKVFSFARMRGGFWQGFKNTLSRVAEQSGGPSET